MTRIKKIATVGCLALVMFTAAALGAFRSMRMQPPAAVAVPDAALLVPGAGGGLDATIASLQARLAAIPDDWKSYASLGQAYVQEARVDGRPNVLPEGARAC